MNALHPSDLLGRALNRTEEKYAPGQLYVEGPMDIPLPTPRVSVVGTRKPTAEGELKRPDRLPRCWCARMSPL